MLLALLGQKPALNFGIAFVLLGIFSHAWSHRIGFILLGAFICFLSSLIEKKYEKRMEKENLK